MRAQILKTKLAGSRKIIFKDEAKKILENYNWPGNIRELFKFAEIISLSNSGVVKAEDVEEFTASSSFSATKGLLYQDQYNLIKKVGLKEFLDSLTREIMLKALEENDNKVRSAISELQISSATFYKYYDKNQSPKNMMPMMKKELFNELH